MKRPAFQFYPKDWRDEQSLRLCSMAARGLWIDLMCLMHSSDRYGHLELAGKPMTADQVARLVGEPAKDVRRWMAELTDNGVCSVTAEGVIFSRRMVRDEVIREKRAAGGEAGSEHGIKGAEHGKKGGRPAADKGAEKPPFHAAEKPPLEPPPAFASASAFASANQNTPPNPPPGKAPGECAGRKAAETAAQRQAFETWWQGYPKKLSKADAEKAWMKVAPDAEMQAKLTDALAKQRQWETWKRDGGRYVPNAATWLNGKRWADEADAVAGPGGYDWKAIARAAGYSEQEIAADAPH